ncbi:MAG: hypothetical protein P9M15_05180, partial [Candidatus Electryoneaceae bacterium]|nr:hypothetical protein [Candidatus Electryoneaceae bacterium]
MTKRTVKTAKVLTILFIVVVMIGCSSDDNDSDMGRWNMVASLDRDFGRQPIWSPDGESILFGDDTPGSAGLWLWYMVNDPELLADDLPAHNWDYCWSNDGGYVAFSSPGEAGTDSVGIWIVDVQQRTATKIYDRGRDVSWINDGSFLAARIDHPFNGNPGIYLVDISSGEANLVVAGGFKPLCSPTEMLITYKDNEINGRLFMTSPEGSPLEITGPGVMQWQWSPNGTGLFCVVNDFLNTRSLTGQLMRISMDQQSWSTDSLTAWVAYPSPNGTGDRVAFLRESDGRWAGLWIYDENGEETRIATYVVNPSFDPTGN